MLEVNGKKGKLLVCSNPDCKHKETVSIITNARCPNCHKKLELVGKKEKQLFVCKTCGYRQSMNAFKKERATKDNEARKSDIKKYLQQQKKQQTNIEDSPNRMRENLMSYRFYQKFITDKTIHNIVKDIDLEYINEVAKELFTNPMVQVFVYGNIDKKDVYTLSQIQKKIKK